MHSSKQGIQMCTKSVFFILFATVAVTVQAGDKFGTMEAADNEMRCNREKKARQWHN